MRVEIDLKDKSYPVFIDELSLLEFDCKVGILTNPKVAGLHLGELLKFIKAKELYIFSIKDGEEYKNFETINEILENMFNAKFDRKSVLITFGGGVISDMGGFVASIYQRGIKFINIPTTLLAQVDASVGGKTGINNKFGKNLIGTFSQPSAVYCQSSFLKTLNTRELAAGMAEAIKMAATFDKEFLHEIYNSKMGENLPQIVEKCVKIKAKVVSQDEKESGVRKVLNYGHTFAHIIEKETNYQKFLHGEAVAIGMNMANHLALNFGLLRQDEVDFMENLLIKFGLPVRYKIPNLEKFYDDFFLDKKSSNDKLTFILLDGLGKFAVRDDIKKDIIIKTLEKFV